MKSVLKVIQQNQIRTRRPLMIRRIYSHRSRYGCSRTQKIWRIPGHGKIRNCGRVQPRQVESEIQGSIFASYPTNAQGLPRREEDVTPVRAEARISSWRGQ